ncbi:hypothetical protein [Ketobacter sp.]|uniref:hypothetical protein n=1 Tax=Ketobacter sp. TaxID=2083498 RepID=UPI000F12937A|nr:hypothetical protein [Ketobacter sp.]RLU00955.1 MAG: hypothetical protein D9N14_04570 [Ketobacter sp.]
MKLAYKIHSKLAVLALTLTFSSLSQALTEYPRWYDGTFDSVTVSFGDLEWLRWDQTLSMSINEALTTFESEGWRLATNEEMADLLNSYFPLTDETFVYGAPSSDPSKVFDANENETYQSWDPATHPGYGRFESDFGLTDFACDPYEYYGCEAHAAALFGGDADGDNQYNIANVYYTYYSDNSYSTVETTRDRYSADYAPDGLADSEFFTYATGVALVRNSAVKVPEINGNGTMIALALLGGLLLVYRERRTV